MVRENMKKTKVTGKNNEHKVLVYVLSTCAWCKMTKKFLKDNDIEYEYVDVDLASDEDHEKIRQDIIDRGSEPSFPTLIIDDKTVITGFRKDLIKEALAL
jgi:glutaredoxin-like protein NrdH